MLLILPDEELYTSLSTYTTHSCKLYKMSFRPPCLEVGTKDKYWDLCAHLSLLLLRVSVRLTSVTGFEYQVLLLVSFCAQMNPACPKTVRTVVAFDKPLRWHWKWCVMPIYSSIALVRIFILQRLFIHCGCTLYYGPCRSSIGQTYPRSHLLLPSRCVICKEACPICHPSRRFSATVNAFPLESKPWA